MFIQLQWSYLGWLSQKTLWVKASQIIYFKVVTFHRGHKQRWQEGGFQKWTSKYCKFFWDSKIFNVKMAKILSPKFMNFYIFVIVCPTQPKCSDSIITTNDDAKRMKASNTFHGLSTLESFPSDPFEIQLESPFLRQTFQYGHFLLY